MEIIINSSGGAGIDKRLIRKLARKISRRKWIVSLSFVSKERIKKLNRKYRRKNKPTDVLSFSMREGYLLGDVVICSKVARSNAKKFGSSLKAEIARLFIHGTLHLLGMDHGKKMFELQDKIMRSEGYA